MPQRSKLSTECLQHEIFRELSKHKAAEVGNPTVLEQARLNLQVKYGSTGIAVWWNFYG